MSGKRQVAAVAEPQIGNVNAAEWLQRRDRAAALAGKTVLHGGVQPGVPTLHSSLSSGAGGGVILRKQLAAQYARRQAALADGGSSKLLP